MLTILQFPCVLVEEIVIPQIFGIPTVYGQWFILGNLIILALMSLFKTNRIKVPHLAQTTMVFLFISVLYLTLRYFFDNIFMEVAKIQLKNLVIGILFVIIFCQNIRYLDFIIDKYIEIGSIIAVVSLVGFFGYLLGIIPATSIRIQSYAGGDQTWTNLSNLGYLCRYGNLFRLQGYWTEPARYAQFLTFPIVLLLDRFNKKSSWHWIGIISLSTAFILTFSNANLISLPLFLILHSLYNRKYMKVGGIRHRIKSNKQLNFLIVISLMVLLMLVIKESIQSEGSILAKDLGTSVDQRILGSYIMGFNHTISYPWGNIGLNRNEELFRMQPAPISALIIGGFPLIFLIGVFLFIILKNIWQNGGKYSLYFFGMLSFIVAICWYGSFFEYQFLFNLALASILFSNLFFSNTGKYSHK
jgi:hypothetical protein